MTPSARLANVNLLVEDPERARAFSLGAFGLIMDERRSAPPHMLILGSGVTLNFKTARTEEAGKARGPGDTELGFETPDLEGARDAVLALGGQAGPIREYGFGRSFDAHDPDGHPLSVYTLREA